MDIIIKMLDGTPHTLRVHPQDTVGSLKKYIQGKLGVLPHKQRLIFMNGQRMTLDDDNKHLSDYGLQSGSQLSLLVTDPPTIQVFLRNEKGTLTTYDVKPDETVSDFQAKVQQREGVQVSQQRLVHQGRELREGRLSDYNVESMSTIDMVFRLRGGWGHFQDHRANVLSFI